MLFSRKKRINSCGETTQLAPNNYIRTPKCSFRNSRSNSFPLHFYDGLSNQLVVHGKVLLVPDELRNLPYIPTKSRGRILDFWGNEQLTFRALSRAPRLVQSLRRPEERMECIFLFSFENPHSHLYYTIIAAQFK